MSELYICPKIGVCEKAYGCPHGTPHSKLHGGLYVKPCAAERDGCPPCRLYVTGDEFKRYPSPEERAFAKHKEMKKAIAKLRSKPQSEETLALADLLEHVSNDLLAVKLKIQL